MGSEGGQRINKESNHRRPFRGLFASLKGYKTAWLSGDAMAALTLAAIAIPEQLATAHLVGLPPSAGLIAFLAGGIAFAAFGAHRVLSVGADSTIAPILAGSVAAAAAAGTGHYFAMVASLSVMVGVILLLTKPLRLGWVADMLSIPVTTGFLAGISAHIIVGQLPAILDFNPTSEHLLTRFGEILEHAAEANPLTLSIGLGVFLISQFAERASKFIPGPFVAIVLSAVAVWFWQLEKAGVPVMEPLAVSMPSVDFAVPSLSHFTSLIPAALVIALVCMMQTAAVEQSSSGVGDKRTDSARDFAAIGAGSLLAGLFGGFAVNSSPPRTAIVVDAGGHSQLATLMAIVLVLVIVLLFAPAFALVPEAALAGVLIYIGLRLLHIAAMRKIYRASREEFGLVLASAAMVIVLPVGIGVGMSIVLSLLHSIFIIARPKCEELQRVPNTTIWWALQESSPGEREPGVLVFAPGVPINFTNANYIVEALHRMIDAQHPPCRLVVLEANGIIAIDFTGAQIFSQAVDELRTRNIDIAVARMESGRATKAAAMTGLLTHIGSDHVFKSVAEAISTLTGTRPQSHSGFDRPS